MSRPAARQVRAAAAAATAGAEWLRPLRDWPRALLRALAHEPVIVRVVITQVLGSAPREAGVCMLVGREQFEGTIGGGQLEWQALVAARAMLQERTPGARLQRMVLGTQLAQCCGGVVEIWIERYTRADRAVLRAAAEAAGRGAAVLISTIMAHGVEHRIVSASGAGAHCDQMLRSTAAATPPCVLAAVTGASLLERLDETLPALWLYGAGHVGQALARIAVELPLRLTWIDSRAGVFPAQLPEPVHIVHAPDPLPGVASAHAGTRFLVLTHSHALDYALCRAILQRGEFASLGLIGSASKAARFRSRLARDGVPAASIARLRCPIGAPGVDSKWPAAIAVAVAYELLQQIAADVAARQPRSAASLRPTPAEAHCSAPNCAHCRAAGDAH